MLLVCYWRLRCRSFCKVKQISSLQGVDASQYSDILSAEYGFGVSAGVEFIMSKRVLNPLIFLLYPVILLNNFSILLYK